MAWAVIGQQINLPFAITFRRSFIQLVGTRHSSGLWCHPDTSAVARLNPEQLGKLKFSRAKAETLVRMAQLADSGQLPLNEWQTRSPEEIEAALLAIKGISPWTVNYTLLRGFAFADCSLHGDAAIKTAIHRLNGSSAKPTIKEIETLLQHYRPHRSMTAAHLLAKPPHYRLKPTSRFRGSNVKPVRVLPSHKRPLPSLPPSGIHTPARFLVTPPLPRASPRWDLWVYVCFLLYSFCSEFVLDAIAPHFLQ